MYTQNSYCRSSPVKRLQSIARRVYITRHLAAVTRSRTVTRVRTRSRTRSRTVTRARPNGHEISTQLTNTISLKGRADCVTDTRGGTNTTAGCHKTRSLEMRKVIERVFQLPSTTKTIPQTSSDHPLSATSTSGLRNLLRRQKADRRRVCTIPIAN